MSYSRYQAANFGPGRAGLSTVGYTLTGGTRITAGVAEVGASTGVYGATVVFSDGFAGSILWDTGQGGSTVYAAEEINPGPENLDAKVSSRSTYAGGAVASVTGNVGGNVVGSVGSVTAAIVLPANPPTDWLNAASVKADAVTKIQSGLATSGQIPANFTTATFASAGVFSVGALANAPTGGSAPTAVQVRQEMDANSTRLAALVAGVTVTTNSDKTGYALASAGLDAIMLDGMNIRQGTNQILAANGGILSGAGSGTIVIKGAGGTTTRITATTDSSGNRTVVTHSPPS